MFAASIAIASDLRGGRRAVGETPEPQGPGARREARRVVASIRARARGWWPREERFRAHASSREARCRETPPYTTSDPFATRGGARGERRFKPMGAQLQESSLMMRSETRAARYFVVAIPTVRASPHRGRGALPSPHRVARGSTVHNRASSFCALGTHARATHGAQEARPPARPARRPSAPRRRPPPPARAAAVEELGRAAVTTRREIPASRARVGATHRHNVERRTRRARDACRRRAGLYRVTARHLRRRLRERARTRSASSSPKTTGMARSASARRGRWRRRPSRSPYSGPTNAASSTSGSSAYVAPPAPSLNTQMMTRRPQTKP